jgi:hypothetical protein
MKDKDFIPFNESQKRLLQMIQEKYFKELNETLQIIYSELNLSVNFDDYKLAPDFSGLLRVVKPASEVSTNLSTDSEKIKENKKIEKSEKEEKSR